MACVCGGTQRVQELEGSMIKPAAAQCYAIEKQAEATKYEIEQRALATSQVGPLAPSSLALAYRARVCPSRCRFSLLFLHHHHRHRLLWCGASRRSSWRVRLRPRPSA